MSRKRVLRALKEDKTLRLRARLQAIRLRSQLQSLNKFCLFIGYPRSGHSLIGALLNAHPELVLAHELDVLGFMQQGVPRNQLLALCLERDRWFSQWQKGQWGKYNYDLPGSWQGRYRNLHVIGDKKGGRTTLRLQKNPSLIMHLEETLEVPVHVIHIVRHPLDNISTMSIRREESISSTIDEYFRRAEFIADFLPSLNPAKVVTLNFENFIAQPYGRMQELLRFLSLPEEPGIYQSLATVVAPSPRQSRHQVEWSVSLIEAVRQRSEKIDFLNQYDFSPVSVSRGN